MVRLLLLKGAFIHGCDTQKWTPLYLAVKRGCLATVRALLTAGADVSLPYYQKGQAIHVAAEKGYVEIVRAVIEHGADVNVVNNRAWTPLYLAVKRGCLPTVQALLAAGADVSLRCGELNAPVLHVAAEKGHVEIVRAVIEHGADVNAVNQHQHQRAALHCAAWSNSPDVIDLLVAAGANIGARASWDNTPLHCASVTCNREAMLCLLKHGAAVNAQDYHLETPLVLAAAVGAGAQEAAEVVDALLRAGADETIVNESGRKAADMIREYAGQAGDDHSVDDVKRVRKLLASAPADRAWRRRGYLVLCRAHPGRVQQQSQVAIGTQHTDTERRARSRAKLARVKENAEDSTVNEGIDSDWTVVVARVQRLHEEGIFRTIVGFL